MSKDFKQVIVFEPFDCPLEVCNEVDDLWAEQEFGNDHYYFRWSGSREKLATKYPHIYAYLKQNGIDECLIHNSW